MRAVKRESLYSATRTCSVKSRKVRASFTPEITADCFRIHPITLDRKVLASTEHTWFFGSWNRMSQASQIGSTISLTKPAPRWIPRCWPQRSWDDGEAEPHLCKLLIATIRNWDK